MDKLQALMDAVEKVIYVHETESTPSIHVMRTALESLHSALASGEVVVLTWGEYHGACISLDVDERRHACGHVGNVSRSCTRTNCPRLPKVRTEKKEES